MAIKTIKNPMESTPIDEDLLVKMRQIYADYSGLQIAVVIAKIRQELNYQNEIEQRKEILANLQVRG
jgi:succinate dehydrogenase/fumarate reductase-like Fe-S protein